MDGVGITIDAAELERVIAKFAAASRAPSGDLMEALGALGESQTRRRITDEKTGPDGQAWPKNLEGTPILRRTGQNLEASVAFAAGEDEVEWGASWEYAHVHQFGATITPKAADRLVFFVGGKKTGARRVTIPPRPFVGVSDANGREIEDELTAWMGRVFEP
jgi:phage gpG-like protein